MRMTVKVVLSSLLLLSASCSVDRLTGGSDRFIISPNAAATLARMGPDWQVSAENPFACFVSMRAETGSISYLYKVVALRFPSSALRNDGTVALFRFRLETPGGEVLRVANCVIPATEKAIKMIRRDLGVPANAIAEGPSSALMEECVKEDGSGVCPLPGLVAVGKPTQRTPTDEEPDCSLAPDCYWGWGDGGSDGGGSGGGGGGALPCLTCGPSTPILRCTGTVQREQLVQCTVSTTSSTPPDVSQWSFQSSARQLTAPGGSSTWSGTAVEGGTVTALVSGGLSLQAQFSVTPRPWRWGTAQWSFSQGTAIICEVIAPGFNVRLGWNRAANARTCDGDENYRIQPNPLNSNAGWVTGRVNSGPNEGIMYVDTVTFRMDRASNINPSITPTGTAFPLSGVQAQACGASANVYQFNVCMGVDMATFLAALWGHEGMGYGAGMGHESAARRAAVQSDNDPYLGTEPLLSASGESLDSFVGRLRDVVIRRGNEITRYAAEGSGNVGNNWSGTLFVYDVASGTFRGIAHSM